MRILRGFFWIVIIVGIVAILFFSFSSYRIGFVVGNSMFPSLKDGDVLIMKKAEIENLFEPDLIGQIVLYKDKEGIFVVHRVVKAKGAKVVTKGDANPAPDPRITVSQIKYVYLAKIPVAGLGKLFKFLHGKMNGGNESMDRVIMLVFLVVLAVLLLAGRLLKRN